MTLWKVTPKATSLSLMGSEGNMPKRYVIDNAVEYLEDILATMMEDDD